MTQKSAKAEIVALIGRPFLDIEEQNFELYYELAKTRLNVLLGGEILGEFSEAEAGLKMLLARMFELSGNITNRGVKRKSIDNFSVEYATDKELYDNFLMVNAGLINRYKLNSRAGIRSGKTIYDDF